MSKVLMIGVDGLDPILLSRFESKLPNFKELKQRGTSIKHNSIFPYDSIPIWSSIYTGLTPAHHGLLKSINYQKETSMDVDSSILSGKTFWDFAGSAGKKVCIINPFVAYPPWPVNGVMVSGPIGKNGSSKTYPSIIENKYRLPHLGGLHDRYPLKKDLMKFLEMAKRVTTSEADFALDLLREYEWDLALTVFITLDGVEHFFWRYYDKDDPTHPDNNTMKNVIPDFYGLIDSIVGRFRELDFDTLIIFGDHGMGLRSLKLVNINEVLRKRNLLSSKVQTNWGLGYKIDSLKSNVLNLIYKYNLDDGALMLSRCVPKLSKKLIKSELSISSENRTAFAADLVGMNSCGGINIVKEKLEEADYEGIRTLVLTDLQNLVSPLTGQKLVKWACRREKLYEGEFINRYPDIVFELEQTYGVSWGVGQLLNDNYAHKIISGGHKNEAVFIINGVFDKTLNKTEMSSIDIAPTVLDLLNVNGNYHFDGRSILCTQ